MPVLVEGAPWRSRSFGSPLDRSPVSRSRCAGSCPLGLVGVGLLIIAALANVAGFGRMVLRRACAEAVTWKVRPITGAVDVAVNISAAQLEDGSLVTHVRGALEASELPPSSLILEMTESALIEESVTAIRSLHQLRAMGYASPSTTSAPGTHR